MKKPKRSTVDILLVVIIFFAVWEGAVLTGKAHPVLVPSPKDVLYVFYEERALMLASIFSSLRLLLISVGASLILGTFLGLFVGWIPRLREAAMPIAGVIGPIPPLVYTPYVVAVMPTFRAASVFVIFMACFWPVFTMMVQRVSGIDKKIIQAATVMGVGTGKMLFSVILPCCFPGILGSLPGIMRGAFLCLTGAELLGASSGLGYFVKRSSDYANYTKVIAGIILMGIVVTFVNRFLTFLQKKLIKWEYV